MASNWKKLEDENGFTYYQNEQENIRQWDHPKFSELLQRLDDCNYIKYSAYRVAMKFRTLQNGLYMDEVPLTVVNGVFERHRLGLNESSLCLESCDLEAVLSDIYFASNKINHTNIDIDFATELMLNFLYNVYDRDREGKIQVSAVKLILGVLSNCHIGDFYKYVFKLCSDHNNLITKLRLQNTLTKFVQVISFLHEDVSFGQHLVFSAVESCFRNSPGLVGMGESIFIGWMEKRPQILSWIPILHRIKLAEPIVHASKCSSCKTCPIMGLLYKCVKCSKYVQCQRCFFAGRISSSHKLSHSMKEFCNQDSLKKRLFLKKLCGLFCSSQDKDVSVVETKSSSNLLMKSHSAEGLCDIEPLSSPQNQLQVVIRQLELQNRELQHFLQIGSHTEKDIRRYLEEHRLHVATQIQKLKILKENMHMAVQTASPSSKTGYNPLQSTPMHFNDPVRLQRNQRSLSLDFLSPITHNQNQQRLLTQIREDESSVFQQEETIPYGLSDISTWIGGQETSAKTELGKKTPVKEFQNDLDDAIAKLQQILANNFTLDESLGDNSNLKYAVSEVEGMLTSFIDNVESGRTSTQPELCA